MSCSKPLGGGKKDCVVDLLNGGNVLIARLWHGRTHLSDADKYAEFMKVRAAPDYSSVDGLERIYFLRRDEGDVAHFLLVTLWDSMRAVRQFAGDEPEIAKYYPGDDDFLLEKEDTSALYEVFLEYLMAAYPISEAQGLCTYPR